MLPKIASKLKKTIDNGGGWLIGLSENISRIDGIELTICFPIYGENQIIKGKTETYSYYGFPKKIARPYIYEKAVDEYLSLILNDVKPDIVHIWGTEYPHTLSMVNVCNEDKIVVSIQGLCSVISKHYRAGLPVSVYYGATFRDLVKRDNLIRQQEKFVKRGEFEIEAIKKIKYVIGRTTWDKANSKIINKDINYFICNETLRDEFYKYKWNIEECNRHSIFISQGSYPIKGLHMVIEALKIIVQKYKDAHLYIAGDRIIKNKIRISSYGKYILSLVRKYNLSSNITFLGNLDEKKMCEEMLKSNVFVCPSSIENSPNSLGEAMLLGVPCVASYVGGIPDLLKDKEEGYIYPFNEPYMLAYYIEEIFSNEDKAMILSQNARKRAVYTHSKQKNIENILKTYESISKNVNRNE